MRQSQNMSWEFFLGLRMNQLLMRVTSLAAGGYNQMTLIREQHLNNFGYDFISPKTQKASPGEIRPRVAFPQWAAGSEGAEEARQPLTDLGPTVHTLCTLCTLNFARTVHTLCTLHFALSKCPLYAMHCPMFTHCTHCDAEANSYPAMFHRSPITPCFFGLVRTVLCQTASFRITLLLQSVWKRMFSQSSLAASTWPCSNAE